MPSKGKTMWEGYDDSRPTPAKPAPGDTDRTSEGRKGGWAPDAGNVTPNQTKDMVYDGWKGMSDQRPSGSGSRSY